MTKLVWQLLDIIEKQAQTIVKQNNFIKDLVQDNLEKENFINEGMGRVSPSLSSEDRS